MKSILGYVLISVGILCLNGCASFEKKQYDSYLAIANSSLQRNDYFDAVDKALTSLVYQPGEQSIKIVNNNTIKAINQRKEAIDKMPFDFESFTEVTAIEKYTLILAGQTVKYTKGLNTTQEMDSFNKSVSKYKTSYGEKVLSKANQDISSKQSTSALSVMTSYIKAGLPANEKTSATVKNLVNLLEEKNEIESVISLIETNKQYFSPEVSQQIISALYKDAKNCEKIGNPKKAINTYKTILEIDDNAVDARNAVNRLLNEVTTIFTVAETGNASDESLSTSSKNILTLFTDKLVDKEKYFEVASIKEFLAEEQTFDVDFDTITQAKDIKFKPARKVRYIVLPKVTSIKINRSAPVMILKTASWDYNVDGNAFSIAAGEYSNYSGGNITHYEYTEGSERVNATQRLEFILYDTVVNKVVLKTRVETRADDSVTWAENPMAVGYRNKVPASYYPSQIRRLVTKNHSAASDDSMKNKLMELAVEQVVQKIKEKLSL